MGDEGREYRVEELAAEAGCLSGRCGITRSGGCCPRRGGRVAIYNASHLERLRLIADLLDRGYRLDGIEELIAAADEGRDVTELLGYEWAAATPWAERESAEVSLAELDAVFGGRLTPEVIAEAAERGTSRSTGTGS